MKKLALLLAFFTFGLQILLAQTKEISGTVTSADDGGNIPGVSVSVKGTTIGTITDFDGKFVLKVPQDAQVLVFSFVGMETSEVPIGNKMVFNIKMQSSTIAVDEVIVTALGIKKESRSLGYSAENVSGAEITKASNISAMNSLQGRVAGANISSSSGAPGASTRVILRGYSSLGGGNEPLYIIDGVPINNSAISSTSLNGGLDFGNRANDINPYDIESMTVLKGGSATALYGSRAANGVILITTKNGSKAGKLKVTYSGTVTIDSPLRIPEYQNTFGQGFYGEPDLIENTSWGPKMDGVIRPFGHVVDNSQLLKPFSPAENNVKDFFDRGVTYNNSFTISNGNEKNSYFFSYANANSDGIFPTDADSYNRNTVSLRGSTSQGKFSTSASLNFINKKSSFVPTGQDQSVYDNVMQVPRSMSIVDGKDYKNKFWNLDNYYSGYTLNPYYVLNEHGNDLNEDRLFGNVDFKYDLASWVKLSWKVGGDVSNSQLKQWRAITQVSRNDYNDDTGRVSQDEFFSSEFNSDLVLNFNKEINSDLNISGVLGHNVNQRVSKHHSAQVIGLDIPYFYDLSNSSATPTVSYVYSKRRLVGVFGSVDIAYKNMLFVTATARNDWSSTLPKDSRSFFYPGVNLGFIFTELLPKNNILPYGKLRMGWGQTGNDADPYQIYSVFVQGNHTDGYRQITYPLPGNINGFEVSNRIGNTNLQPELSTEFEIGTDLRFLSNRIGVDFTYYNRTITDLIWPATLAASTGYTTQVMNLGKITNKGVEILVSLTPVKTKNFDWTMRLNFTKNQNELVELAEGLDQIDIGGTSTLNFVARPGYPIGLFYGAVPLYHDGKVVVDSDGLPQSESDFGIYGDAEYDYIAGVTNELTYKGLSLSFTVDIKQGGMMYSRTAEMQYFSGTAPLTLYNDREPFIIPNSVERVVNGDGEYEYIENTHPISYSNNLHTYWGQDYGGGLFNRRFTVDKSYVKLREVVLSYNIPKKLISKLPISDLQVSLIGHNLLLFTPSSNTFIDPESTTFGNNIEADYGEFSSTPSIRSIGGSVKLSF